MHVPDHLINNTTELVAVASAAAVVATVAMRSSGRPAAKTLIEARQRFGPQLATAALVFALQMVNFPVASGTSGHLFGGALATALIGPRRAMLAVSSVVIAQALFFADGGVGALGVNLWLIAIIPVGIAALVESFFAPRAAHRAPRWWAVAGIAAVLAPPVSAVVFTGFHATGAFGGAGVVEVAGSMLGVHAMIGIGEAVVTLVALGAVQLFRTRFGQLDARPVWGVAAVSGIGLALLASSQPDGLERAAADLGFAVTGAGSMLSASPLADYGVRGLDGVLSSSIAAALGLGLTCAVCAVLVRLGRTGEDEGVGRAAVSS